MEELKNMSVDELEARRAAIAQEFESITDAETCEARSAELDAIKEELEARKALEAKKAELRNAVDETVKAELRDNIEKTEKKEERKMFEVNSVEYRNAWLADLMGREVSTEARAAITAAAATIPTETLNKLAQRIKENKLLAKVDLMQIPGYVRVPIYSTSNDASWTSTSTDSADVISYIDLKPYQLIKTFEVGCDMDKMSFDAFEAEIVKNLANKIESALQKAVIVGTGATGSQPKGIASTVSSNTGTFTQAAITKKDLMTIMGALPADFQEKAVWIMPNKVFFEAMAVADLNGFAGVSAGIGYQIGGKPVIVDDNCIISNVDTIFYGDPTHYRLNLGEGIKVDKDLSLGFRSNSAVYRGVCQADGQLDMAAAFVRYARAS